MPAPSVWAPLSESVELALADGRVRMRPSAEPDRDGWWVASEPLELPAGTDYAFVLDGSEPGLPDPRSPWQPNGVHGPSRTLDHAAFEWTDGAWQAPPFDRAIVYELHTGTFTPDGTFDSAIEKLDHLVSLGVTHVELMPVAEYDGERGWGYDGVALYAPHHTYGGPDGLKRFVDAAHGRGLAVLLDVVYNHVGPSGNYLPRFGPYLSDRYRVPWGEALNFDGRLSDEVRRFVVDNALMWLRDYHFDGLRLDAVQAIFDQSALNILEELSIAVDDFEASSGRHLVLVAESDLNDPRVIRGRDEGGYGIDAQWNDDFHHALHTTLTTERYGYYADFEGLPHLARAMSHGYVFEGEYSRHRRRRHGRSPAGLPSTRLLGYLQDHDQIANRAAGERSSQVVTTDALMVAAAIVLLSPFVPMLFMGEEWAASTPFLYFTDHKEPLGEAIRQGRREEQRALGWADALFVDPQSPETFERSKLDWSELNRHPHDRLLNWHRSLIDLRQATPELSDGRYPEVRCDAEAGWLVIAKPSIVLAANLSARPRTLPVSPGLHVALASSEGVATSAGELSLPPMSAAVLRQIDLDHAGQKEHSNDAESDG